MGCLHTRTIDCDRSDEQGVFGIAIFDWWVVWTLRYIQELFLWGKYCSTLWLVWSRLWGLLFHI